MTFDKLTAMFCGLFHGRIGASATNLFPVATKYYTHFVTARAKARSVAGANEWSGVVELRHPLEQQSGGTRELRALLAQSFDLDSEDIKILHWARLH